MRYKVLVLFVSMWCVTGHAQKALTANEHGLTKARKGLEGRWEIANVNTDMAICGIPIDYCSWLPLCERTRVAHFSNGALVTDDTSAPVAYRLENFVPDSSSFRLIIGKDTFCYSPWSKSKSTITWWNGEKGGSLYYSLLTFTLHRERRRYKH